MTIYPRLANIPDVGIVLIDLYPSWTLLERGSIQVYSNASIFQIQQCTDDEIRQWIEYFDDENIKTREDLLNEHRKRFERNLNYAKSQPVIDVLDGYCDSIDDWNKHYADVKWDACAPCVFLPAKRNFDVYRDTSGIVEIHQLVPWSKYVFEIESVQRQVYEAHKLHDDIDFDQLDDVEYHSKEFTVDLTFKNDVDNSEMSIRFFHVPGIIDESASNADNTPIVVNIANHANQISRESPQSGKAQ